MIRLKKGESYDLIEFMLKYDKSLDSRIGYYAGTFYEYDDIYEEIDTIADMKHVEMDYINEDEYGYGMVAFYIVRRDSSRHLHLIMTKVPVEEMRQWREHFNIDVKKKFHRLIIRPKRSKDDEEIKIKILGKSVFTVVEELRKWRRNIYYDASTLTFTYE